MVKTMKQDITKAIQFSNTFRYIDDFFSITEQCGLWKAHQPQFPLRNWNFSRDTSTSSTEVCYLDTNIKTDDINTPFRISF